MSVTLLKDTINSAKLSSAAASWPTTDWTGWHRYTGKSGNKFGSVHYSTIPRACENALRSLADTVEPLLEGSFIDYDLHGAGLHMIPPGGFLGRHLDAECHPIRNWKRTHSIVLFVDEWDQSWGGELVLEGHSIVSPARNNAVIFETKSLWHEVLPTSPEAAYRRTLALFAWKEVPVEEMSKNRSANFST